MAENFTKLPDTVALSDSRDAIVIIDQTLLPGELKLIELRTQPEIWEAIKKLRVRGAPAIGVTAGYGYYLAARELSRDFEGDSLRTRLSEAKSYLASSRPTAVNLFWALERMEKCAISVGFASNEALVCALLNEATAIRDEDVAACRKMGELALTLVKDGDGILTHCNAGQLATVRYGTALSPIHVGRELGYSFKVYCDETRPLLQGARLSAYELMADGVDTTVICDNMASQVMKDGKIDAIFVGADRIAANGDACNKIGTSGVAILAKHYGIPFYVVAPTSTVDMNTPDGFAVPIEQREPDEVSEMWYASRMTPEGVKVFNPAFDFAENALITAIITEKGIARAPYTESLAKLMK